MWQLKFSGKTNLIQFHDKNGLISRSLLYRSWDLVPLLGSFLYSKSRVNLKGLMIHVARVTRAFESALSSNWILWSLGVNRVYCVLWVILIRSQLNSFLVSFNQNFNIVWVLSTEGIFGAFSKFILLGLGIVFKALMLVLGLVFKSWLLLNL